ncbi:hypothetical protein ABN764_02980 [Paenibacillaceae sp. P-4]|uniref:hypothetical protein n=1 Tax=Paenibacillaceae bacterium P-4 TaxID=3160969 RepID=UPI0032E83AC5
MDRKHCAVTSFYKALNEFELTNVNPSIGVYEPGTIAPASRADRREVSRAQSGNSVEGRSRQSSADLHQLKQIFAAMQLMRLQ